MPILENLQQKLKERYGYTVILGAEVEFYLNANADIKVFDQSGIIIEQERGEGQYEAHVHPQELSIFIGQYQRLKQQIIDIAQQYQYTVTFAGKPFANSYGSATHIHLNLLDERGNNIFGSTNIDNNLPLLYCINGILELLEEGLGFFANAETFSRFDHHFMAPTHLSWGGNNRTTTIRIPDSSSSSRRIEFRVPSADCEIEKVLTYLLIATNYGLKKKITHHPRIYGNAFDRQYNLLQLPSNLDDAKNLFIKKRWLKKYLSLNKFMS